MKNVKGIWLPDHEEHLLMFAKSEGWSYQKHKLDEVMNFVKKFDVCIDIGGHCGLWSMHLVKLFQQVHAFEPVKDHRECYVKNVISPNYKLYPYALGNEEKKVSIHTTNGSSGDSWVQDGDDVECKLLDSFRIKPDFIKIDTEGFEYYILLGGEKTIKEHKPTIIVEQKPNKGKNFGLKDTQAVDLLKSWGYTLHGQIAGDYVLSCN
jgi:FkbM family methyltransferase